VRDRDLVIIGSFVPDGVDVAEWALRTATGAVAFYDIDTPVTLAALTSGSCEYLERALIPRFDLYLSFTGGPTLHRLEREFGARRPRPLYCSFDPAAYFPERREPSWDLGYMGTFSADRQPALERLLLGAARRVRQRFVVAGPGYDAEKWPPHVEYLPHVAARDHREFYTAQRFTLNLTRADMIRAGHSPSVRLFEAAACGVPIISDSWRGLDTLFKPGSEILIAESAVDTVRALTEIPERERAAIGRRARRRVLAEHTAEHRAAQLEEYLDEARGTPRPNTTSGVAIAPAPSVSP
jgi:spore maturation protein CgeB